jgi:hypothetical protein
MKQASLRPFQRFTICAILAPACTAIAQNPKASAPPPDFSGMWLVQDPGSGSFTAWFDNVPKPQMRPEIVQDNQALEASANAGNVVNTARRTAACPVGNLPLMMASSPALNIVAARDEVLLGAEANRARFIYTDGRDHAEAKSPGYRASGFGHSIGHWEGNTLVVDTVGFPARVCDSRHPVMVTPGGGRAKDTTHLVERFQLVSRDEMTITFTWDHASVFVTPHSYSYNFKRVENGVPFENNDDARDPGYQQRQLGSVSTPDQK